ncbi:MAG: hypothetical protein AB2L24_07830 [Mangrovibacterium sp.]
MDVLNISRSDIRIGFYENQAMTDYLKTQINIFSSTFRAAGDFELLANHVKNKEIRLQTSLNTVISDDFKAMVRVGEGTLKMISDLSRLN